METWLNIDDYPKYDVSDEGRVRNARTGKILKPGVNHKGYRIVSLHKDGSQHTKKVHRIVAETFKKCDCDGFEINHINGDKSDNSVDNLEWCTGSENILHSYKNGLRKPPRMKRVKIIETGEVFESFSDCARSINGDCRAICACEAGRQSSHRGYHFEFLD